MDWFSDIGRRVWLAYQEGLEMTCPAHRECGTRSGPVSMGQIAARDSNSALPTPSTGFAAPFPFAASGSGSAADDAAAAYQQGSSARH